MKIEKANQEMNQTEETKIAVAVELNEQLIEDWKTQYGKIFRSVIDGKAYIWRKLKRKEYVELMAPSNDQGAPTGLYERQEAIAEICTLWPTNMIELMIDNGGLATSISDEVLRKSGFDIEETVEL